MKKLSTLIALSLIVVCNYAQTLPYQSDFSIPIVADPNVLLEPQPMVASPVIATERDLLTGPFADTLQAILDNMSAGAVGMSAAFQLPDGQIWVGTSGQSSATDSLLPDMRLAMGSISKTFTAACILQLYDEGVLGLDDPLDDWLPAYEHVDSTITIRQLLNHTSGIYNYTNNPALWVSVNTNPTNFWEPEEILATFVLEPVFPAGTNWGYSNTNYILLGLTIEAATGNTYHQEIRDRFIDPLGLTGTALPPYEEITGTRAHLWTDDGMGGVMDLDAVGFSLDAMFSMAWAAGAFTTTPTDLTNWGRALGNGSLLSFDAMNQMQELINLGGGIGYGLGVIQWPFSCDDGWGHGGDIVYSSQMYYFPQEDVTIAVQSNDGTLPNGSASLMPVMNVMLNVFCNFLFVDTEEPLSEYVEELLITPNPFVDQFTISYDLTSPQPVRLSLLNAVGQEVALLEEAHQPAGEYTVDWSAHSLPGGWYFCKLQMANKIIIAKLIKL